MDPEPLTMDPGPHCRLAHGSCQVPLPNPKPQTPKPWTPIPRTLPWICSHFTPCFCSSSRVYCRTRRALHPLTAGGPRRWRTWGCHSQPWNPEPQTL